MAIGSPQWMYASGEAYTIDQSLKFEDGRSTYLSKTFASAGNRRTWTWSAWVKRGNLVNGSLFACNGGGSDAAYTRIAFHDNSSILVTGNNTVWKLTDGTQHFRDISSWYHIVVAVDTTQASATDRMKMYVNGSQVTNIIKDNLNKDKEVIKLDFACLNVKNVDKILAKVMIASIPNLKNIAKNVTQNCITT